MNRYRFLSILAIFISLTGMALALYFKTNLDSHKVAYNANFQRTAGPATINFNHNPEKNSTKKELLTGVQQVQDTIIWVNVISSAGLNFQGW
jgi:hypothetical protein